MKKGLLIALVALLCCGFIPQHKAVCQQSDSQPSLTEAYAEAIKSLAIHQDTLQTISQLGKIIARDSNYAPALNMLARVLRRPDYAAMFAERAYNLDTTNFYYLSNYGQALLRANEYEKAIPVYRKIIRQSSEANDYRILAILLDNAQQPMEVLSVLDSAVVRFGRIPEFSRMRQITYMNLGQTLMALSEAQKDVELAPYIAENHVNLARTYATMGQDSLALVYFQSAVALDTLEVAPWVELGRFYRNKENKGAELSVMERLFANPNFSLGNKIAFWKDLIQNRDDYGKFYPQYDALIKRLYIYNGGSREVAELYAEHLIASGEKEASLQIYKRFLNCKTPKLDDFEMVINFESYLNRHDSVDYYVRKALRHYPNNANLRITQGYLAFQRNEYDNSVLHFNEALEIADSDSLRCRA